MYQNKAMKFQKKRKSITRINIETSKLTSNISYGTDVVQIFFTNDQPITSDSIQYNELIVLIPSIVNENKEPVLNTAVSNNVSITDIDDQYKIIPWSVPENKDEQLKNIETSIMSNVQAEEQSIKEINSTEMIFMHNNDDYPRKLVPVTKSLTQSNINQQNKSKKITLTAFLSQKDLLHNWK